MLLGDAPPVESEGQGRIPIIVATCSQCICRSGTFIVRSFFVEYTEAARGNVRCTYIALVMGNRNLLMFDIPTHTLHSG